MTTQKLKQIAFLTFLILAALFTISYAVNKFFETHTLVYKAPVAIHFNKPISIIKRVLAINVIQEQKDNSPLNELQQYICNKFGKDCRTALAIAKAESNYNCNEINVNSNNSVDFGIFQENSVHLNKQFTFSDLANCNTQIDAAYKLYQQQGFSPWSTYTSGAYKKYLY